ncbi:MAG: methylmalonyl-CoA epimerase [Caldisericia bacterium]
MFKKIHHIGIAVKNLDECIKFYEEKFNLKILYKEELEENKVKVAGLKVGDVNIELLEPLSNDSPIQSFLMKKGEGIHHIAYLVEDISHTLNILKEKGIVLIDEKPRTGSHGTKIAFLHPKNTFGVLIELVEV